MNRVVLIGRLTRDPELRYTASGMAVAKLTLAVNRKFVKDGQQEADFIPVTAFGKSAETIAKYITKGRELAVEGRLQISSSGEGTDRKWFTDVVIDSFDFIGPKGGATSNNDSGMGSDSMSDFGEEIVFADNDIPF